MAAVKISCVLLMALAIFCAHGEESGDVAGSNSSSVSTSDLIADAERELERIFNSENTRELVANLTSQLADLGSHLGNLTRRLEAARDRAARVLQESLSADRPHQPQPTDG